MSRDKFAKMRNIPASTFRRRLDAENVFESPLIGRTSLLPAVSKQAIADAVAKYDERNNGVDSGRAIGMQSTAATIRTHPTRTTYTQTYIHTTLAQISCSTLFPGSLETNARICGTVR